jgi:predicted dehydrogenase
MLGQVDGVIIDHRDGACHFEVAEFFIRNKVPTFVDKPITTDLAQAKTLFRCATEFGTPLCTFGIIPLQRAFRRFANEVSKAGPIQAMNTSGPATIDGPYGGVFFYGFHQIDAIVEVMGTEVEAASISQNGRNGVITIFFSRDRIATANCLATAAEFGWQVCTDAEVLVLRQQYDKSIYLAGTKVLHRFFETGKAPWSTGRMLAPIAILEAVQKSLLSGRMERVSGFQGP